MAWPPLAVALVSSGSRGNKLLLYHSGVTRPQSLENGLYILSKYDLTFLLTSHFCMNCVQMDRVIKVTNIINIIYYYNVFITIC